MMKSLIPESSIDDRLRSPHLQHLVNMERVALLPGDACFFVKDATLDPKENPGAATPWVLVKWNEREIKLKCACGRASCTRELTFTGKYSGSHPQRER